MSHYTVAVFTENGDEKEVERLLAPYDENLVMERYICQTKQQVIEEFRKNMFRYVQTTYAEYLKDPKAYVESCKNEAHIKYVRDEFPKRLLFTDEECFKCATEYENDVDEDGNVWSTRNPNSKWDWYQIGGRWYGSLKLKPYSVGVSGEPSLIYFADGVEPNSGCDAAMVRCIDFDAMREEILKDLEPYEEAMKDSFFKEEYMRKKYPSEEMYKRIKTAYSTYAVILPDGTWHAPGEMGWFGCSSEEPEDGSMWELNYYDRFIVPAIEKNWCITIVDCHI